MADNTHPLLPRRRTTIEIPLHSIRKYVPGSGPPPPRISLVPPRDSTAYIIDQFVLPPDKDMTPTSRRLIHYHIGFDDLPAVKLLVPCTEVLDYVSPRELEDWEYQNEEKKEVERARLLAEKQRAGPAKKKPGRPRKVPMEDVGMPVRSSADEALLLAQQVAGPSLSTPKKRKLELVLQEEMGDTSNMESDDAIHRQFQEVADSEGMEFEDELADSESADQLGLRYDTSGVETPSRVGSLARPLKDSCSVSSATTSAVLGLPGSAPAPAAALTMSATSTPGRIHPAWAQAFGQQKHPANPINTHSQGGHAKQNGTPWTLFANSEQPKPSMSAAVPGSSFKASNTPKGPSSLASTPSAGAKPAILPEASARKRKAQPNGKGPSQEKQQRPKKPKVKQEPVPVADEWEVKELLDDQWFIEQGVKVHRYLVLWEGNWPEDQNPTWEPAENVQDNDLIKRYQKKKKAGLLKPPKKAQKTMHQFLAGAKYASVAEAFEGGIDEQTGPITAGIESDTDPPNETFLVTENLRDVAVNGTKPAPTPTFGSFDSILARYNQVFPRG